MTSFTEPDVTAERRLERNVYNVIGFVNQLENRSIIFNYFSRSLQLNLIINSDLDFPILSSAIVVEISVIRVCYMTTLKIALSNLNCC